MPAKYPNFRNGKARKLNRKRRATVRMWVAFDRITREICEQSMNKLLDNLFTPNPLFEKLRETSCSSTIA